jgi:hypothetical protein
LCNAGLFYYFGAGFNNGDWVAIEVDDKRVARFPLTADHFAHIQGLLVTTGVEIKNGRARIACSSFKLKVCSRGKFNTPTVSQPACPIKW